ncbi:immunoglobulin-like domain-containing protein [Flavobacterium cellulosilyticum]|uniref:DUF5011 domain-containing protein n=1 Tax=Flavobacterium cellulosilyticum TaxID=2541731 RepID=A0A4R5CBW0_9FLAO|nr:immunoglobulin-like domain-containing protein [Flavobacterium cellulosilyticum]TDD96266.1 DUF5011 domain-containing protein [Flavobacterium cellulosilyticum]
MKKIIIALFITGTFFTACTTVDTDNVSRITYFPVFTISGANPFFVLLGTPYTDPGAVAKAGSTVITHTTAALGKYRGTTSLDTNKVDEYFVTYSAKNADGFVGSGSRKVIVYKNGDLINSIEGLYTSTVARNGVTPGSTYIDIKYIYIWKNTDGTYQISDAFGGWYEYGRAIGSSETPGGTINAINITTNNFTFPGNPLTNKYFGGVAKITDLTVNAATKTLVLTCTWTAPTAYTFVSTLKQVQP